MLVQYTSIHSLSANELAQLKRQVSGMRVESNQQSYQFAGKTFSMMEINSLRQSPPSKILLG